MTREQILQDILSLNNQSILIQAGTGLGKTFLSLKKIEQYNPSSNVLIVIPKLILIQNWIDEINKWGMNNLKVTFTTYVSLHKHAGKYDIVLLDEAHHLTPRCIEALKYIQAEKYLLLSATIKKTLVPILYKTFPNLYTYKVTLQEAIDNEILPEPKIILIPLKLSNKSDCVEFVCNPKGKRKLKVSYNTWCNNKWIWKKDKDTNVTVKCTEQQWYLESEETINYLWKRYSNTANPIIKNAYLKKCGDRLTWLSERKMPYIKCLLRKLDNYRTLTFCNNIKQTYELGEHCINSKNNQSIQNLDDFNNNKINHIQAVAMLDEGTNLTNCKIGIFANINSSERLQVQRTGRLMRHKEPVIIIPYYKNTREEDIVLKMIEDYNPALISYQTIETLHI